MLRREYTKYLLEHDLPICCYIPEAGRATEMIDVLTTK